MYFTRNYYEIFHDNFWQNIKSFSNQNSKLRIHSKPDRNQSKLTVWNGRLGSSGTSSTCNFSIIDPFFTFPQYLIDLILDWPCPFKVDLNFESINGFSACFSRILNQWIYDFFPRNFTFHFLEGSKVSFSVMVNSTFDLNRKQNKQNFVKENRRFRNRENMLWTWPVEGQKSSNKFFLILI